MPVKHQLNSYRTRDGVRCPCYGDYPSLEDAKVDMAVLRSEGRKMFYETHEEGYVRVFVFPDQKTDPGDSGEDAQMSRAIATLTAKQTP